MLFFESKITTWKKKKKHSTTKSTFNDKIKYIVENKTFLASHLFYFRTSTSIRHERQQTALKKWESRRQQFTDWRTTTDGSPTAKRHISKRRKSTTELTSTQPNFQHEVFVLITHSVILDGNIFFFTSGTIVVKLKLVK